VPAAGAACAAPLPTRTGRRRWSRRRRGGGCCLVLFRHAFKRKGRPAVCLDAGGRVGELGQADGLDVVVVILGGNLFPGSIGELWPYERRSELCGRVTDCPAQNRDFPGRVRVGMGRETTRNGEESVMCRSIGPGYVTAAGASLAGAGRVNKHDRHAGQLSLVRDKATRLVKRPRVQPASLRVPNLYPAADTAQRFQSDGASGALHLLHKLHRGGVVDVGHQARLAAGKPFEHAPCRLRTS
jgi:hypothetical protein